MVTASRDAEFRVVNQTVYVDVHDHGRPTG